MLYEVITFQDVMTDVGIGMEFGLGKTSHPFVTELPVENKILFAPENRHGPVGELLQPVFHFTDQGWKGLCRKTLIYKT